MKLFTVGDESYIGTHRTVPVSFITDCKSDNSTCKFCQPSQSVTVTRTTIWLTITRGQLKSNPVCPRGGWLKTEISDFSHIPPPPGAYWWGADWKRFTGTGKNELYDTMRNTSHYTGTRTLCFLLCWSRYRSWFWSRSKPVWSNHEDHELSTYVPQTFICWPVPPSPDHELLTRVSGPWTVCPYSPLDCWPMPRSPAGLV